jgi:hypothetical protein
MRRATAAFVVISVTVSLLLGLVPYLPALPAQCVQTASSPRQLYFAIGESVPANDTGVGALVIPPGCTAIIVGTMTRTYAAIPPVVYNVAPGAAIYLPGRANLTNPQNIFPTSSVRISASPGSIPYTSSNASFTYTITTTLNSTGFYYLYPEGSLCPQVWLAVASPPIALDPSYWGGSLLIHCTPFQFYFQITSIQGAWIARIA